jgi:hypothetical protein
VDFIAVAGGHGPITKPLPGINKVLRLHEFFQYNQSNMKQLFQGQFLPQGKRLLHGIILFLISLNGNGARRLTAAIIQSMLQTAPENVPAENALQMFTRW